ncbi:MAG TPA: hypothetical protein VLD59_16460 [Steroidobacteraceae bacterium]|nr:hypothetical protein [Steroidobacteraceae bacterium]
MPDKRSMTPAANASRQWLANAVLSAAVLEPLHELNRRWLTLLMNMPRLWPVRSGSGRLPEPVGATLIALTPERCVEIARCPFSLFTASFNDGAYWRGIAGNTAVHEPRPADQEGAPEKALVSFAELALFYAWHLARVNPAAARIVLGMTDQTLSAFEMLTLTTLQNLAASGQHLLAPRWPDRAGFWLQLLEPAASASPPLDVRLVGLQMMAAELTSAGRSVRT